MINDRTIVGEHLLETIAMNYNYMRVFSPFWVWKASLLRKKISQAKVSALQDFELVVGFTHVPLSARW